VEKGKTVKFSNQPVTVIKENWTAGGCKQNGPCIQQVLAPEAVLVPPCSWHLVAGSYHSLFQIGLEHRLFRPSNWQAGLQKWALASLSAPIGWSSVQM